jgi:hypothetical protein
MFSTVTVFMTRGLQTFRNRVHIHQGLPTEEMLKAQQKPLLLVLDDLMIDAKSDYLEMLFTRGSHHYNISVVFVTQNIFSKDSKTARNNAHYVVLLRNPRPAGNKNLGLTTVPTTPCFLPRSL